MKTMNLLIDKLPEKVTIGGMEVPIDWDFRTSVRFQEVILDKTLSEEEKILKGLRLYYPTAEDDIYEIEEAIDKMLWFYEQGRIWQPGENTGSGKSKQAFSFVYDAPYIYAAFMDQYGIDLQEVRGFHWWKFKALFDSFRDDLLISQIMKYRVTSTSGMDKETASFYRRMKKIYALPVEVSSVEQKELDALNKALAGGGDVTKILTALSRE